MKNYLLLAVGTLLLLLALNLQFTGCTSKPTLRILAADALAHSFRRIQEDFQKQHPQFTISLETQGSILLSRLAVLRPCDVLAVADKRLVKRLLTEKNADWVIGFASTELVLLWTDMSKHKAEVNKDNWWKIIQRDDVQIGLANPDQDPCGYFTLMSWKLAELHLGKKGLYEKLRAKCPKKKWALHAGDLLARMQAFNGDYAFAYRCHAQDMHMPFLPLPKEINLGERSLAKEYARVAAKVPNYQGGAETVSGSPIIFGITIPKSCKHRQLAQKFIKFCLSEAGHEHLAESSLCCLKPPIVEAWGPKPDFLLKEQ